MNGNELMTAPPRRRAGWGMAAIVFLFALACYLPMLGDAPLAATEAHRALSADSMVKSGDWLIPRLYGQIYLAKPPLHYWIQAIFELIGGATPFVWRLPSCIEGALLAAILYLFGRRWFGPAGGLVSGFGYVTMVTLWGENRGADIDVTNTLAATLAALCIIDVHIFREKGKGILWILAAGLAVGASLMVKGPAGLTIILGTVAWCAFEGVRQKGAQYLLRASLWLPLVIGAVGFAAYAVAAYLRLTHHHLITDWTGIQEGMEDLHPHDWTSRRFLDWITLPETLWLFSLPVSLALPLALRKDVRGREPRRSAMMKALAGSVILAWLICMVSGMHLPRYAFVTLPLMCPLAGAVAADIGSLRPRVRDFLRSALVVTAVGFLAGTLGISAYVWRNAWTHRVDLAVCAMAAVVCAGAILIVLRGDWRAAWGIVLLAGLLSIPFGFQLQRSRLERSSVGIGQWLATIVGDRPVYCCAIVRDQPDIFYYGRINAHAFDGDFLDWSKVPEDSWVVAEPPEFNFWEEKIIPFVANKNRALLIWYAHPHWYASLP